MLRTLQGLLTISITQIVVRQYNYWSIAQIWAKQLFAAGVEVIAVNEGKYGFHVAITLGVIMTSFPA